MTKIIGLDPGISHTGWVVIKHNKGEEINLLDSGTISTNSKDDIGERLCIIFRQLNKVVSTYLPNEAAVEKIFVNRNPKSSLTLGYARGVAILTLKIEKISISEYDANYIKKNITGDGHANKDQVMFMVKQIVKNVNSKCHHVTDALATAICHIHCRKL